MPRGVQVKAPFGLRVYFRLVYDWAGVRNGRAGAWVDTFAEANRAAMARVRETGRGCRVFAGIPGTDELSLVAEYAPGSVPGLVLCGQV